MPALSKVAVREIVVLLDNVAEQLDEEEQLRREYVRAEHVPFLETRFRTFDSYISSLNELAFLEYSRLRPAEFADLLSSVEKDISHRNNHRSPISAKQRLVTWLRWVGHGYSFSALRHELSCGASTVSGIVVEVTEAIIKNLFNDAFPPLSKASMVIDSKKFSERYDYPRCVGALDGKHFAIKKPDNCGSLFWNYKHFHSIVLLALVNADYQFTAIDCGAPGKNSDSGIFSISNMKTFFDNNDAIFPDNGPLGTSSSVPYHILVDGGFGMGLN